MVLALHTAVTSEQSDAWIHFCAIASHSVDERSFLAGWDARDRLGDRRIDEVAFVGRQIATGHRPDQIVAKVPSTRLSA